MNSFALFRRRDSIFLRLKRALADPGSARGQWARATLTPVRRHCGGGGKRSGGGGSSARAETANKSYKWSLVVS